MTNPETPTKDCACVGMCGCVMQFVRNRPETPTVERFRFVDESMMAHCEMSNAPDGKYVRYADYLTLQAECERLRKVNTRLNRRAQSAEAAADTKAEDWNKRAAGSQLRNHYYVRAIEAEKRAEKAEAECERLREWKESAMAILGQWDALAEALKPHAQIDLGESIVEKLTEQIPPQLADLARLRAEKAQK